MATQTSDAAVHKAVATAQEAALARSELCCPGSSVCHALCHQVSHVSVTVLGAGVTAANKADTILPVVWSESWTRVQSSDPHVSTTEVGERMRWESCSWESCVHVRLEAACCAALGSTGGLRMSGI